MSKTNRMYKVFMTVMVTIITGLLLACGVIAVKNSMRVKMSIPANPNFLIEIYIQKDGENTQNLVFKNFGEVQIQNGIAGLNANTLVASDDFVSLYGGDFSIIIKNFTENMPMLVTVTSRATLANGNDGVPAEITAEKSAAVAYNKTTADEVKFNVANKAVFPQTTLIEINFQQIDGYVVSFNANGGSGAMSAQQHALGGSTALTDCAFTAPAGKEFAGWATNPSGPVVYVDSESVSNLKTKAGEEIVLYAIWGEPSYTITFNANGGTGTMASVVVAAGESYTLPANTFTFSPHNFISWNTAADGSGTSYNAGTSVVDLTATGGQVTLYAQWTYTATFVLVTGSTAAAAGIGFVITNDSGLSFITDSSIGGDGPIPYFRSTSNGGVNSWIILQNASPGSTPIATVQSGTGYYYKETYYNTAGQTFTSSHEVKQGDFIFILGHACSGDGNYATCLSSYSTTPSIDYKNVTTFSYNGTYTIVVNYVMPKDNIQLDVATSQCYVPSGHTGGGIH